MSRFAGNLNPNTKEDPEQIAPGAGGIISRFTGNLLNGHSQQATRGNKGSRPNSEHQDQFGNVR